MHVPVHLLTRRLHCREVTTRHRAALQPGAVPADERPVKKSAKPRLSAGKNVQIEAVSPDLAENAPAIRTGEKKEPLPLRAGRSMFSLALGAAALAVVIVAILSATVLVALPADGHRALVLRGEYANGNVPAGALVYVSSYPAATDIPGKTGQALVGVPAGSVVQIVTGPNQDVTNAKNGTVLANGKPTPFKVKVAPIGLDRQYIAVCISGSGCTAGKAVTVPQGNIIGGVRGYLTTSGLTAPATPVPTPAR